MVKVLATLPRNSCDYYFFFWIKMTHFLNVKLLLHKKFLLEVMHCQKMDFSFLGLSISMDYLSDIFKDLLSLVVIFSLVVILLLK